MGEPVYQIYDKIFKKILTLSSGAVINMINGLFDTQHAPDGKVHYHWTEFEDGELKRILADTIITIDHQYSYHLEAQMTNDADIVLRVFEYSYSHANRYWQKEEDVYVLPFPESKIIYLYTEKKRVPEEYTLKLDFGTQGHFMYRVSTFNYLEKSVEELNRKKMVILIPFQLLKLREAIRRERSQENLEALKKLIHNDIIHSIDENQRIGNITLSDAFRLKRLTHKLYEHIYAHYEEMEEINDMTDESLLLDIDILEREFEEKLDAMCAKMVEKESLYAEAEEALARQGADLAEAEEALARQGADLAEAEEALARQGADLAEKDKEIAELKRQIAAMQQK